MIGMARFPLIDIEQMSALQQEFVSEISAGPRGGISGPFIPLVHAPELARRIQKIGEYLRFESSLSADITEMVILLTAKHWKCDFEWHFHVQLARQLTALSPSAIDAIAVGKKPVELTAEQSAAYLFCMDIQQSKQVSDAGFNAAKDIFGLPGALELLALCGYYSMLAMILNAAQLMPPGGPVPELRDA